MSLLHSVEYCIGARPPTSDERQTKIFVDAVDQWRVSCEEDVSRRDGAHWSAETVV